MKRRLVISLAILAASLAVFSYALADTTVYVKNRSEDKIRVSAYNANDSSCFIAYQIKTLSSGEDKSIKCAGGQDHCKLLIVKDSDVSKMMCVSGAATHTCYDPGDVVYVQNQQTLTVGENGSCEFVTADADVSLEKQQLPVPGGGVSECLWNSQAGTILSNSLINIAWQGDGNLVAYQSGIPIWASGTAGNGDRLCFQGDGNLVIYKNGSPTWSTGTQNSGWTLHLQADCNLSILDIYGNYKWGSGKTCR